MSLSIQPRWLFSCAAVSSREKGEGRAPRLKKPGWDKKLRSEGRAWRGFLGSDNLDRAHGSCFRLRTSFRPTSCTNPCTSPSENTNKWNEIQLDTALTAVRFIRPVPTVVVSVAVVDVQDAAAVGTLKFFHAACGRHHIRGYREHIYQIISMSTERSMSNTSQMLHWGHTAKIFQLYKIGDPGHTFHNLREKWKLINVQITKSTVL